MLEQIFNLMIEDTKEASLSLLVFNMLEDIKYINYDNLDIPSDKGYYGFYYSKEERRLVKKKDRKRNKKPCYDFYKARK